MSAVAPGVIPGQWASMDVLSLLGCFHVISPQYWDVLYNIAQKEESGVPIHNS